MNRIYKFRAWCKKEKKMIYPPSEIDSSPGSFMTLDGRIYKDGVLQDVVLMQFTGLIDKNGKEIYDQDILSGNNDYIALVVFDDEYAQFAHGRINGPGFPVGFGGRKDLEVIGNIYENPELLEV